MLTTMLAVVITRPGRPEVLALRDVPDPVCGPEEVEVRVRATALNRADLLQRRGRYPAPPGAPADIPGLEFAGTVERCGNRVQGFHPGDRVMGLLGGGGYAERVAIHERLCMPVPPAMPWAEAAAIPEAFLTAYDALVNQGGMTAGERVLVHAAGSGVGIASLQLARAAGARALGLSRTESKRQRLVELGLGPTLDPAEDAVRDAVRRETGGRGVDLVLDMLGASAWELNISVLADRGRLVLIGLLGGRRTEVDLAALISRRLTVVGSVMRSRPLEERVGLVQQFARRLLPLFADGTIRPVVDRTMPLGEVAEAHALMERNENCGKIVLELDGP
jgi:putative PIG3 family NAD(P)H quinone oxidoreductase